MNTFIRQQGRETDRDKLLDVHLYLKEVKLKYIDSGGAYVSQLVFALVRDQGCGNRKVGLLM